MADETLLTKLELEVMQAVWGAGADPLTVREVVERLNAERGIEERSLAYNTVQTVLTILRDKGVVTVEKGSGRAHLYRPKRSREEVSTSLVGDLVERVFGGEVQPLLQNLVERPDLERSELEELRRLIDERLGDERDDARKEQP